MKTCAVTGINSLALKRKPVVMEVDMFPTPSFWLWKQACPLIQKPPRHPYVFPVVITDKVSVEWEILG